jgi:hypothetical protein
VMGFGRSKRRSRRSRRVCGSARVSAAEIGAPRTCSPARRGVASRHRRTWRRAAISPVPAALSQHAGGCWPRGRCGDPGAPAAIPSAGAGAAPRAGFREEAARAGSRAAPRAADRRARRGDPQEPCESARCCVGKRDPRGRTSSRRRAMGRSTSRRST